MRWLLISSPLERHGAALVIFLTEQKDLCEPGLDLHPRQAL